MIKKTRRKRKKPNTFSRIIRKKNLAKNFIIFLTIILILLLLGYFFLSKENQETKQSRNNNILENQKLYTNDEVMKEVIEKLNPNHKNNILEAKNQDEINENINIKKDEKPKTKEDIFKEELKKDISKEVLEKVEELDKSKTPQTNIKNEDKKVYKEIEDEIIEETHIKKSVDKNITTAKDKYKYDQKKKPKLVIIIDDVVSKAQKDKILDIGYSVNMSFLPPNSGHKESASIAQNLSFYMIHFPMQASKNFKNSEEETLNILDSYEKIEEKVKQLRLLYPKAIYTNNHTGSVFTENYEAMHKLFRALKKYNFIFVDSKTTPNSVAKELSVKFGVPYIVRDTFLDNNRNFTDIQNQLKDAIRVAKKQGYAVAIGHPYDITIKVLKESKHLLNEVEPIFLDKLPYL